MLFANSNVPLLIVLVPIVLRRDVRTPISHLAEFNPGTQ
jgi:hypothetical protein